MNDHAVTPDDLLPSLTIETLVNGGAGLARYQGKIVFIPHTAVGDIVVARVSRVKKNYVEAEVVGIVQPATLRCTPRCPVAGECGGCQWQHLPYAEQLIWKEKLFRETLIHQCNVDPATILPIVPSPSAWHYRSRVQIKCYNSVNGFITGYYRPRSRYVVAVDQCPIMDIKLNQLLRSLRAALSGSEFAGDIPQIDLYVDNDEKQAVVIHYLGRHRSAFTNMLKKLSLQADLLLQFRTKNKLNCIQGNGILQVRVDHPDVVLQYAAGSFAQVNLQQNRSLVTTVLHNAIWRKTDRILELYCGMGNFSLSVAKRVERLVGVEESTQSIAMAHSNAADNQVKNAEFYALSAEDYLSNQKQSGPYDAVLLDPPRTGAYPVIKKLLQLQIPRIVYVSCDSQTLARDLRPLLYDGYQLVNSQAIDMFPQTFHCESVTVLEKRI